MSKNPRFERRMKYSGPLQDLLFRACPPDANGVVSLAVLAETLGMHQNTLYRCVREKRLSRRTVRRILAIAEGRVSREDLLPYLLGEND